MAETWGEKSLRVIHKAYTSIKVEQPDLDDKTILRMVSLHYYPFGPRENWPYAAWLKAMRKYREALRLPPLTTRGFTEERPLFEGQD